MSILADVCGAAFGLALLFAILMEGGTTMVLFAPMLKRKWLEQGRKEGREEGREEGLEQGLERGIEQGREEMRQRYAALEAWRQRKREAEDNKQPFDEPPPSL